MENGTFAQEQMFHFSYFKKILHFKGVQRRLCGVTGETD